MDTCNFPLRINVTILYSRAANAGIKVCQLITKMKEQIISKVVGFQNVSSASRFVFHFKSNVSVRIPITSYHNDTLRLSLITLSPTKQTWTLTFSEFCMLSYNLVWRVSFNVLFDVAGLDMSTVGLK